MKWIKVYYYRRKRFFPLYPFPRFLARKTDLLEEVDSEGVCDISLIIDSTLSGSVHEYHRRLEEGE